MTYYDPDFGFLFLKAGWQRARKEALRMPLTTEWLATVSEWVQQATVSEGLRSFQEPLKRYGDSVSLPPEVVFAEHKTSILTLLSSGSKKLFELNLGHGSYCTFA